MPSTYEKIATTTLGSAASSITFSSISSAYTDLVVVVQGTYSTSDDLLSLRYNNDTGSNYSSTTMYGNGTSALSYRTTSATSIQVGWYPHPGGAAVISQMVLQILNYSNATTYKTNLSRGDTSNVQGTAARVGLWRSTAAINRIDLIMLAGNLQTGTTATVYGIKAA
jgi:hypothetical protein